MKSKVMKTKSSPSSTDKKFLRVLGSRVLSEANDLKRTPEILSAEMTVPLDVVRAVLAGETSIDEARSFAIKMANRYPVSLASIWVEPDDTEGGALIMRAAQSNASARTLERRVGSGQIVPYYEYLDTAMSRTAPFKPEIVRALSVVDDVDPNNPHIAMNHGHLMHQLTFYVGKINVYWTASGMTRCMALDTGDSTYMAPFVPHSFASRDPNHLGYIVAVTYAGPVRFALDEFSRLRPQDAEELVGDWRRGAVVGQSRLQRFLMAESLSEDELMSRALAMGLSSDRTKQIMSGCENVTIHELKCLANCLSVRPRDLLVDTLQDEEIVTVMRSADRISRIFPPVGEPRYKLFELTRSKYQPSLKAFEFELLSTAHEAVYDLRHHLHEYVFNYGMSDVDLHWGTGRNSRLKFGDSAYIAPMVQHGFNRMGTSSDGRLVVVRVPGTVTDAALAEFAGFDPHGRSRTAGESMRWY